MILHILIKLLVIFLNLTKNTTIKSHKTKSFNSRSKKLKNVNFRGEVLAEKENRRNPNLDKLSKILRVTPTAMVLKVLISTLTVLTF